MSRIDAAAKPRRANTRAAWSSTCGKRLWARRAGTARACAGDSGMIPDTN
jgi:hypothetical protein